MCCLLQGCPFGTCPLWRMLHPQSQLQFHHTGLPLEGLDDWGPLQAGQLWHHRLIRWHHPSTSHLHLLGAGQQHHTSKQCSRQVSLWGWESPLTHPPPNLLPQVVRTPTHVGGRLLEAEMVTVGSPAAPREHVRGPLSGRPVSRHLIRRVGTPPGHLTMFPQLQHLEAHHVNVVVTWRLLKTLWRMSPIIGAKGGGRTLNMSSGPIISPILAPLRRQNGIS